MDMVKELESGAIGGLAGGTLMAAGMMIGKRAGMVNELPPAKLERELEDRGGFADKTDETQETALGVGGHMAFSALLGAGYAVLQSRVNTSPVTGGLLYGLGVYFVNRVGIGPSLDLTPSPADEDRMSVGRNLMMHLAFGAVTGYTYDRVRQSLKDAEPRHDGQTPSAFIAP